METQTIYIIIGVVVLLIAIIITIVLLTRKKAVEDTSTSDDTTVSETPTNIVTDEMVDDTDVVKVKNCEEAKAQYLNDNPDVKSSNVDAWDHYYQFGRQEGRTWSGDKCEAKYTFTSEWKDSGCTGTQKTYEATFITSHAAGETVNKILSDFQNKVGDTFYNGKIVQILPQITGEYTGKLMVITESNDCITCEDAKKNYIIRNPDVGNAGVDAWEHYYQYGKKEGRAWIGQECPPAYKFTSEWIDKGCTNNGYRQYDISFVSSNSASDAVNDILNNIQKEGEPFYNGKIINRTSNILSENTGIITVLTDDNSCVKYLQTSETDIKGGDANLTEFKYMCPNGSFISKVITKSGDWTDAIQVQCSDGTVSPNYGGQGGGAPLETNIQNGIKNIELNNGLYIDNMRFIDKNSTSYTAGPNPAFEKTYVLSCNDDIAIGIKGQSDQYLSKIGLVCGKSNRV